MADPKVRQRISRLGVAARRYPDQVDDRRRELEEVKLELAAQEFLKNWPNAWPALKERLGTLIGSGAQS
jgi:hypothetical protein